MTRRVQLAFDPIEAARNQWTAHGWDAAAPGMALITSIVRMQQIFLARVEQALRPLGLSMARYEVLVLLLFTRNGELPLNKLGERLQVHQGAITNSIDRLVADGYVRRAPHPTDGRTTMARITAKGRTKAMAAVEVLNERVYETIGLSEEQIEQLFDLLRTLRCWAGDFSGSGTTI